MNRTLLAAVLLPLCAACVHTVPPTAVQQPLSARPVQPVALPAANGAIFQAGVNDRALFEDRRARRIGDTLTIAISERTAASRKSNTNSARASNNQFGVTSLAGLPGKSFLNSNLNATSDFSFDGSGESASNNDFNGVITVTVIEVLANGNLQISGEKQLGINQGAEFIRFSGIVNPLHLTSSNTVSSTLVADARIEYRANGALDSAQVMGWLSRFFLNFLPF
jgi:flagellar L-ring protein precursor FlgH